jgi:hypothetical protein
MITARHLHLWILAGLISLAQAAWCYSVRPGVQVVTVKPGTSQDVPFEVVNDAAEPVTFSCTVRDSFVLPENKSHEGATWVKPQKESVTVPGKGSVTVPLKVTVPADAKGELSALVSFSPQIKEDKNAPKASGMETKIVTLVTVSLYVRAAGTEISKAELGELTVANVTQQGPRPASIVASIVVKNPGNVHQRPSGTFEIFKKGEKIPTYRPVFNSGWPVMPYSDMKYDAKVPGELPAGKYEIHSDIKFGMTSIKKKARFEVDKQGNPKNFKDL